MDIVILGTCFFNYTKKKTNKQTNFSLLLELLLIKRRNFQSRTMAGNGWTNMEALDADGVWCKCEAEPPNEDGSRYISFMGWSKRNDRVAKEEVRPATRRDVEVSNLLISSFKMYSIFRQNQTRTKINFI